MLLIKQISVYLNIVHFKFKQTLSECFRKQGLSITPEQFVVLDTLWDDGAMSQQRLADIISKDKNSVTKLVDGLEKKQMLRRVPSKTDRRVNIIEVTDLANQIKAHATEVAIKSVNCILNGISDEDLQKVVEVFTKINCNIDKIDEMSV